MLGRGYGEVILDGEGRGVMGRRDTQSKGKVPGCRHGASWGSEGGGIVTSVMVLDS